MKISVVVNTCNEESNIERCLESVKGFADEIIVVDMHSTDKTVEIAKKYTDKIFTHEYTRYVEPARNFAISKTTGDWVLVLDADEQISDTLSQKLKSIVIGNDCDYIEIPRKNIIFGKWIENSRWWPDYNIRFFRRGAVKYSNKIHQPPQAEGVGLKLDQLEQFTLNHYHYTSISQYIERLNRYSDIQADGLVNGGYRFNWRDILAKPTNEFISRFYFGKGYRDGLHGLVLSLLQAFSELVVYLKVWEKQGFNKQEISGVDQLITDQSNAILHWRIANTKSLPIKLLLKIKKRL